MQEELQRACVPMFLWMSLGVLQKMILQYNDNDNVKHTVHGIHARFSPVCVIMRQWHMWGLNHH